MWFERNVIYSVCIYDFGRVTDGPIQFFLDFWNFFNFAKPLTPN